MTAVSFDNSSPDHDPLFDSAWLKWGQAVVHTQTLQVQGKTFREDAEREPLATIRTEYQPKRHGFAVIIDSVRMGIPRRWGLLLGDIANNYRSSLDHLAWALVTRGRTPPETLAPKKRRLIYFPVCQSGPEFNGIIATQLPGVRRPDLAKVRARQPYKCPPSHRGAHFLSLLAQINTGDKHRTVQPINDLPETAYYEVTDQRDCVVTGQSPYAKRLPLKVDTEVAFIKVRKTGPNPYIEVEPHGTALPALEQNVWMHDWLYSVRGQVALLLLEFSEAPPDIESIGIDYAALVADTGGA